MARRSISPDTRRSLLTRAQRLIADGASPSAAARAVGIDPATLSRWQAAPRLVPVELAEDVTVDRNDGRTNRQLTDFHGSYRREPPTKRRPPLPMAGGFWLTVGAQTTNTHARHCRSYRMLNGV